MGEEDTTPKDNQEEFKLKVINTIEKVSTLRGLIITKFVDIEAYIGVIIENYFVKSEKHTQFNEMVLSDPYLSFGTKKNVFKKIMNKLGIQTYPNFKEDLDTLGKIRNRVAHSMMFGFEGELIYQKEEKLREIKKIEEIYNEFMKLWIKAFQELERIFFIIIEKPNPTKTQ